MIASMLIAVLATRLVAQTPPPTEHHQQVIYGHKQGAAGGNLALVMDVFQPKEKANGRGLIFVVSGGWVSGMNSIEAFNPRLFVQRGYTVFCVVHGSQPKYTIPEILEDYHRAVRYIRHHAKQFNIDPEKLGIFGGSSGGHLSLMQAVAGAPGDPSAVDAVDRQSSRVAAVACFFPPTDFLNYGGEGVSGLGEGILAGFAAAFDFHEWSPQTARYQRITDPTRRQAIGRQISPIYHVSADDPPALIIHGDADEIVPIQQARTFAAKLQSAGGAVKLIERPGAGHGWYPFEDDLQRFADFFDEQLK